MGWSWHLGVSRHGGILYLFDNVLYTHSRFSSIGIVDVWPGLRINATVTVAADQYEIVVKETIPCLYT